MKRFLLAFCLLAACRDEAAIPQPVSLTPEAVGYFCQMNILDHGGPKAQVHLDVHPGKPLFFSQVRDLVTYLRMPEKDGAVQATYVTDMGAGDWAKPGTLPWIAAETATYVVGSSRLGGMDQPETVPFARIEDARAFIAQYGGQMMSLSEIPDTALGPVPPEVLAADEADYTARMQKHDHSKMQGGM